MVPLGPVVVKTQVNATRITVWAHLVRADLRADWWPELSLDPRFGGVVTECWSEGEGDDLVSRDATGEIDVLIEGHALGFRWKDAGDSRQTAVLVTLRSADQQTAVTVSEMGFDALSDAADRAASSQEGWRLLLSDLAAVSEASGNVIPDPPAYEPEPELASGPEPDPAPEPEVSVEAEPSDAFSADEASPGETSTGEASTGETGTGETSTGETSERDFERVLRGE
ncbi:MAG: SRPBCC family protein [Leucobacter sp.]